MTKTINLCNGKVTYNSIDSYCGKTITIRRIYNDKNKHIEFSQWDDYGFKGYIWKKDYQEMKKLDFEITKNDPLYLPLELFLESEKQIIIDDDENNNINENIITFIKEKDLIRIEFIDNRKELEDYYDHFRIFIKNIGPDNRSKIDCYEYDTKERLYNLFNNFQKVLLEKEEQLTKNKLLEKTKPNNQTKKL